MAAKKPPKNPAIRFPRLAGATKVRKAYGAGPITVSVKAGGAHRKELLQQTRIAARQWNRAAGTTVFKVQGARKKPSDVTVRAVARKQVHGQNRAFSKVGQVKIGNRYTNDSPLIAHELGHTLGLGHPTTPKTRRTGNAYQDKRFVLSNFTAANGKPSRREGRMAARLVTKGAVNKKRGGK